MKTVNLAAKHSKIGPGEKHRHVVEALSARIRSGDLRSSDRLPTFEQIKAEFGVAMNTVNRALIVMEQDGLIVRKRGSGIYVADAPIRTAALSIGCIGFDYEKASPFSDSNASFYTRELLDGIMSATGEGDVDIVLTNRSQAAGLSGILLTGEASQQEVPSGIPIVAVADSHEGIPAVKADDFTGMYMATKHLLALGHTRVACMMFVEAPIVRMRLAGYRQAMFEAGIMPDPAWIFDLMRDSIPSYDNCGAVRIRAWLNCGFADLGCTAILAQNDWMAISIIEGLKEADLRVPEDISVVGFDGTTAIERSSPTLTTVAVPVREIGRLATQILIQQIRREVVTVATTTLPVHLVIGGSTALARR